MRIPSRGRALSQSYTTDSSLAIPLDQTQARAYRGRRSGARRASHSTVAAQRCAGIAVGAGGLRHDSPCFLGALWKPSLPGRRAWPRNGTCLGRTTCQDQSPYGTGHLREAADISATHGMRQLLSHAPAGVMDLAAETALEFGDENLEWLLGKVRSEVLASAEIASTVTLSRGELQLLATSPTRQERRDRRATRCECQHREDPAAQVVCRWGSQSTRRSRQPASAGSCSRRSLYRVTALRVITQRE